MQHVATVFLSPYTEALERDAEVFMRIWVALMCRCAPEATPAVRSLAHQNYSHKIKPAKRTISFNLLQASERVTNEFMFESYLKILLRKDLA